MPSMVAIIRMCPSDLQLQEAKLTKGLNCGTLKSITMFMWGLDFPQAPSSQSLSIAGI